MGTRGGSQGCEPLEDQNSSDIGDVIQISKPHLVAGGVTVDLFEAADRVNTKHEATKQKDLSEEKGFPGRIIIVDEEVSHQSFCRRYSKALNESTNVGVKTGRSPVEGPKLYV